MSREAGSCPNLCQKKMATTVLPLQFLVIQQHFIKTCFYETSPCQIYKVSNFFLSILHQFELWFKTTSVNLSPFLCKVSLCSRVAASPLQTGDCRFWQEWVTLEPRVKDSLVRTWIRLLLQWMVGTAMIDLMSVLISWDRVFVSPHSHPFPQD